MENTAKWVPAWRSVPIDYHQGIGTLQNVTQSACFLNNLNGDAVRLRLQNRYSNEPMGIAHGSIAVRSRRSGKRSPWQDITLHGATRIQLPPDTECWSDELPLDVTSDDDILVLLYFEQALTLRSVCVSWSRQCWQSMHFFGDERVRPVAAAPVSLQLSPWLAQDAYANQFLAGFSQIAVKTREDVPLVALFGDSITHMGYYSDELTRRLYEARPGGVSVVNAGIGGNRIARDYPRVDMPGGGALFGAAGKDRIVRDVFDDAAPDQLFLLEGVNDCTHSFAFGEDTAPTAEEICLALREAAEKARERGTEVIASTIMPFGSFTEPWRERAEALRMECNTHIRAGALGVRVLDLDALMRDPDDAHLLQAGMDLGDRIHPGPCGGRKIARALFEELLPRLAAGK